MAEVRRLKMLHLVADLSLDKQMLQDVLRIKAEACSIQGVRPVVAALVPGERSEGVPGAAMPAVRLLLQDQKR